MIHDFCDNDPQDKSNSGVIEDFERALDFVTSRIPLVGSCGYSINDGTKLKYNTKRKAVELQSDSGPEKENIPSLHAKKKHQSTNMFSEKRHPSQLQAEEEKEKPVPQSISALMTSSQENGENFYSEDNTGKNKDSSGLALEVRFPEWNEKECGTYCDICWDEEVIPENQIIFCDACNVAVHQRCYGIDEVPSGNYFCHPCIHNGKNNEFLATERREDPRSALTRTPVICELCPRRHGAFVQTETAADSLQKPRWVHVGCAKWSGLDYVDFEKRDMIEDVAPLKAEYQSLGITCALCKSGIGAMHQCRVEGCNKWLHLTCARCVGSCSVQHGENCDGPYGYPVDSIPYRAWSLACLEHSDVDPESIRKNSITVEQLVAIAKSYPPEPVPPKPFPKLDGKERREYWADRDNLEAFVKKVQSIKASAFCAVCEVSNCDEQCEICGIYFHKGCVGANGKCYGCEYTAEEAESANYKAPICKMCNDRQGPVLKTYAKPVTMKKWKKGKGNINKSLFGPNNFCHVLCGL